MVLIGSDWFEKFLYKGNGEVSKELLSNFFKNSVLVLAIG